MTRQTKTPKQRAEEALGVAERRHKKAVALLHRLSDETAAARADRDESYALLEHAKNHPALQTPGTTPTQEEGTQA